ncbi:hypothetical protein, partial [Stenotrophomonas sp. 3diitr2024]|uniref:hypothetical protein n=1 Tax=Stenotrophomonas sp. 3diitr2024 TaxID=3345115 RepID=UPI0035C978AA
QRIAAITAQPVDAPGGTDATLAAEVEAALLQVGYHAEEAAARGSHPIVEVPPCCLCLSVFRSCSRVACRCRMHWPLAAS